jgi:septal ring factor EnvC (AmiA/AmiB activator)
MNANAQDRIVADVEQAANDVLAELERLRAQISELPALREQVADLNERMTKLRTACSERQDVIDTLQAACDERLALINRLHGQLAASDTSATAVDEVDWRAVALERGAALERLSAEAERRAVLLAEVTAALHERTEEVGELRRARARTS